MLKLILALLPVFAFALSEEKLEQLHQFALSYMDGNGHAQEIYVYIENVLENKDFQDDPEAFLKQWDEKRGLTKEFRVIEDSARIFFRKHFPFSSCK